MISFESISNSFILKNKANIRNWIINAINTEQKEMLSISFVFCTDDELLKINREALNHDYYTDIITFELNEKNEPIESDIYISIDRVRENAKLLSLSFNEELLRVIIHGVLHLCGYKDKKKKEKENMREMENYYLKVYGVSRGTK